MTIKNKPDYKLFYINRKKYLTINDLYGKSGIYIFFYLKTPIYVGASQNLYLRCCRDFDKDSGQTSVRICAAFNRKRMDCHIYFYDKYDLLEAEKRYIKKFNPISQMFSSHTPYCIRSKRESNE